MLGGRLFLFSVIDVIGCVKAVKRVVDGRFLAVVAIPTRACRARMRLR